MSTLLIAYDGSSDARHAIAETARMLPGAWAVVLHVRPPLESVAAHLEGHPVLENIRSVDDRILDAAERLAAEGAEYAGRHGLAAEPRVASYPDAVVADVILDIADQVDASLIVLGSRGRRGLVALVAGSTSTHVLHAAHRPVLVVPSGQLAARRQKTAHPTASAGAVSDRPA